MPKVFRHSFTDTPGVVVDKPEYFRQRNRRMQQQLGMSVSSASHRLRFDLLFQFVKAAGIVCYRCGEELTRDTFSVEHKEAWLNKPNAVELYFDLNNITYSHRACNSGAADKEWHIKHRTPEEKINAKRQWQRDFRARSYSPEQRRDKYLRNGT